MEYRFKAEEWTTLTAEQKARRCRLMAEQARAMADGASPTLAESYLRIADDWITLATEIERAD